MKDNQIPIGILEVFENLEKQKMIQEAGDWLYLSSLKELAISATNIEYQASEIKETAERKRLWEKG